MANKQNTRGRNGLIHCDNCGEDYSSTYKRCPFCDEYEEEYEAPAREHRRQSSGRGGKRLANTAKPERSSSRSGSRRSGIDIFYWVPRIISVLVIVAAIWIVVTKIMPMVDRGDVGTIDPDAGQSQQQDGDPDSSQDLPPVDPSDDAQPSDSGDSAVSPSPDTSPSPSVDEGTATGFTLSSSDVTLEFQGQVWTPGVTFTPEGSTGQITWESDDPDVASVSADGEVTAVGLGTTTISAMLPNGVTQACIVRCKWSGESSSSGQTSTDTGSSSGGSYTVNNPDFTFYRQGETYTLKVTGYSGSVSWTSSNTSVVTVASDGTCTAVGNGRCTITGTLDNGSTVEAIARVNIS